jgi:soluble lytic murein transglycosylase
MNRIARRPLVALGAVVSLGLLLTLLAASSRPVRPQPTPVAAVSESEAPNLPWEPFRHPGQDLLLISDILQGQSDPSISSSTSMDDKLEALSRLSTDDQPPLVHGLADFASGLLQREARRPREAAERFLSPWIDSTELGGHALYFASGALADTDPQAAIEILDRLVTKHADFALINAARLRRGRLLVDAREHAEAARLFQDILTDGQPDFVDEALYELGSVLPELDQEGEAVKLLERLYYEMPTSPLARDAGRKLTELRRRLPAEDSGRLYRLALERAGRLYESERYRDAYHDYTALLNDFKSQVDTELMHLRRGVCQYYLRQSGTADQILQQVRRNDLKAEALYYRALVDRRSGRQQGFEMKLAEVLTTSPGSPWAEKALWNLASDYMDNDQHDAALGLLRRLVKEFRNGEHYVDAQWYLLWSQYRQKQYREAAFGFEGVAREHPASDELSKFLYWGARAHEGSGQVERAVALYRQVLLGFKNTYYGRRAEEHLVQLGGVLAPITAVEPARVGIDLRDALGVYHSDRETRIAQLLAMGLYEEATLEATRSVHAEGDPAFLATVAWIRDRQGRTPEAMSTMRRAFPFHVSATGDLLPKAVWQIIYPLKYWDLVQRYSEEQSVDPYLVAALIRQESTFNAGIRSPAGARGLMQIMPGTGSAIAREQRRRYQHSDLYDPDVNVRFGTHYFRKVLNQFGGRVDYALASYNAGPHRVRAWTRSGSNADPEEFIEEIPFTETRNYVKLVLRNEMLYRRIYAQPASLAE